MIDRIKLGWHWLSQRPIAMINLAGLVVLIIGGAASLIYFSTTKIDVLKDWELEITSANEYRVVDGKRYAVYNPSTSLIFKSHTNGKTVNANGTITRTIICEPTETQPEREIQLDSLPATRPKGATVSRDNAIVVPDVSQFAELPRFCKLAISIAYNDVVFFRDHNEYAETDYFIVEEVQLDPEALKKLIEEANDRIKELERKQREVGVTTDNEERPIPAAPRSEISQQPTSPSPTTSQANQPQTNQPQATAPRANPTRPSNQPAQEEQPTFFDSVTDDVSSILETTTNYLLGGE